MKECPVCKAKTIPNKWVLFGKSEHKNGYCFKCPNCQNNVRKKRWLIIDLLLVQDWVIFSLFLLFSAAMLQVIQSFIIAISGAIFLFILMLMGITYFTPLREADEAYCRGEMTKLGAVLSLIFIAIIVAYTLFALVYMPLFGGHGL